MTKRLRVLLALKAMIAEAVGPFVEVVGLENDGVAPEVLPEQALALSGRVVIRAGDPGEATMDLSPLTYNYEHQIPLEIAAYKMVAGSNTAEQQVDGIIEAISAGIKADRTLGGEVDYLDGFSPATDDLFVSGAQIARSAEPVLIAIYSTTEPL